MATIIYWQDPDTGATESVRLDAVQNTSPDDQLTITDHPVEGGATITDHAQKDPNTVTIEGLVSNIPSLLDSDAHQVALELELEVVGRPRNKTITLDVPSPPVQLSPSGLIQAGVSAIVGLLSGAGPPKATVQDLPAPRTTKTQAAQVFRQDAPRDRVRDVYELLLKAQEQKLLCTIQTRRREYFDMLLKGISQPDTLQDGNAGRFILEFRYIKVADSETVQAPQPTEARGHTATSRGSQNPKTDPNADKKRPLRSTKKEQRLAGEE